MNKLSASEIARGIAQGDLTSEEVVTACLARIEEREDDVRAWSFIDREAALRQARICDQKQTRGLLHGVPIGIKDIIDTADMPTQMGSPVYRGFRPLADASCVSLLRQAGAVILGKTVTCEFAGMTPGPTRNPLNLEHTPGGSSSGSAAAVADFMVPAAFGTQTGGSILRPASFCGVVGYKPSFGRYNRAGIKFAAESFDTLGTFARTVEDLELLDEVLAGGRSRRTPGASAPAIAICRTYLWDRAKSETITALESTAESISSAGGRITEVVLPPVFAELTTARARINEYERARALAYEWHEHREVLSDRLQKALADGYRTDPQDYRAAQELVARCRAMIPELMQGIDALLTPCVPGEAPRGLDHTGDPKFQELWTALHTPSISVPAHRGVQGLPVGVQLVGAHGQDEKLLAVARWITGVTQRRK